MSHRAAIRKPATIARVVCDPRRARAAAGVGATGAREFTAGDAVWARTPVQNDGICPHRDIGETLVHPGDTGTVRESWSFLGEIYYTVEFVARAAIVIMRGREMASAAAIVNRRAS
jgi:nitrogen fixation protein NifZ